MTIEVRRSEIAAADGDAVNVAARAFRMGGPMSGVHPVALFSASTNCSERSVVTGEPYASRVTAESAAISTPEGIFVADVAGEADAPLVLLLHGFPQSRFTWRDVLAPLASAGLHAVAPDQRGYTPGVRPSDVASYAAPRLVADVLDLAGALGAETFHLVGHDWGGQVAWLTAAAHPDRVKTLTVLSRPHPAAFRARSSSTPSSPSARGITRDDAELTDRWWADNCAALRTTLAHAGVPAPTIDAYMATFAERDALDAAMNGTEPRRPTVAFVQLTPRMSSCLSSTSGAPPTRPSVGEPRS